MIKYVNISMHVEIENNQWMKADFVIQSDCFG